MGVALLLFIALVVWVYFWAKGLDEQENKRRKNIQKLYEEQREKEQRLEAATSDSTLNEDSKNTSIETRKNSPVKRISEPIQTTASLSEISQHNQRTNAGSEQNKGSLNTGITELDGPGMFHRLTRFGPSASVVYLLHSKKHNAYKVGYCDPRGIANRIKQIRPEVPDVKLTGTAVFTSSQNAFNAEQKILDRYRRHRYSGIRGRWSGSTEWITQRPTGRPYLTKPSAVEDRYKEEIAATPTRPIEEDIYTVYLMSAPSKGMHKAGWCATRNIQEKLDIARNEVAPDAKIISRFPIQNKARARSIAIRINEDTGTFQSTGGREIYKWIANPSYLNKFKDWDPNGLKIK